MNRFVFAFKRFVRRPLFVLMLVVYVLAVVLAAGIGERVGLPAAGVFDASKSEESGRVVSYLLENGFVECEDPETMTELVRSGQLDCAVVIPENLVERMEHRDLDGCVPWIVTPTSFVPDLYKDHVAAALFREYVPYLGMTLFEETIVPQEEVLRSYEKMFEGGYAFSFDLVTVEGGLNPVESDTNPLVIGVSAILLCAVVLTFCADIADVSFRETAGRIGLARAITMSIVPGLIVRVFLAACAGCIGLIVAKAYDMIVPMLIYTLVLAGIGLVLSGLLRNVRYIYTLLALLVIASGALCPIYTDVAALSPVLSVVRYVLPPYWLWLLPEHRLLGMLAAICTLVVGFLILGIRYVAIGKYCLRGMRPGSRS